MYYCHICIQNINCVLNELILWSRISSDHPVFIQTVGGLTNKNLPTSIIETLSSISNFYKNLNIEAKQLKSSIGENPQMAASNARKVSYLIEQFLSQDRNVINFLPQINQYGKNDPTWQELIHHIINEQNFMLELFSDIRRQVQ